MPPAPSYKPAFTLWDSIAAQTGRSIDLAYAYITHSLGFTGPFFQKGWGDLHVVDFEQDAHLLRKWPPTHFDSQIQWTKKEEGTQHGVPFELLEGRFRTPCVGRVWDALPTESRSARVHLLQPKAVSEDTAYVVHLAGTGDHSFQRRIRLGVPLLAKNVATVALESPFYGARRPPYQTGSKLARVSDLLTLGRATIEESLFLLHWATRQGYGRLGMSGFSMGGVHACMVAALFPGPLACAPLLAPRSAAVAFCDGALAPATAWQALTASADEKQRDVLATVMAAARPNALTSAAVRVLRAEAADLSAALRTAGVSDADLRAATAAVSRDAEGGEQPAGGGAEPARQTMVHATPQQAAAHLAAVPEALARAAASGNSSDDLPAASSSASAPAGGVPEGSGSSRVHLPPAAAPVRPVPQQTVGPQQQQAGRTPVIKPFEQQQQQGGRAQQGGKAQQGGYSSAIWAQLGRLAGLRRDIAREEARLRLNYVLETYTDVTRFPRPQRPDAAVLVAATHDAYVARSSALELAAHWRGAEVRWVPGGHVSSFLFYQDTFRTAIADALARL